MIDHDTSPHFPTVMDPKTCDPLYYYPSTEQQAIWQSIFQMDNTREQRTGETGEVIETTNAMVVRPVEEMLGAAWVVDGGAFVVST